MDGIKIGTEIKLAVSISSGSLTMDDFDFSVDFYTRSDSKTTIVKAGMARQDDGTCLCVLDTSGFASGILRYDVVALIPDSDCEDGYRTEMTTKTTTFMLVL